MAATAAAVLLSLVGPAVAGADQFTLSRTDAGPGDEVEFTLSGTQAGDSYVLKIEDQEVASGIDSTGNGVTDKFTMPDFGDTARAVSAEVTITPADSTQAPRIGSQPINYSPVFSGTTGTTTVPQLTPVQTVPVVPETTRQPSTTTTPKKTSKPKKESRKRTKHQSGGSGKPESKTKTPASNFTPAKTTTPAATPAPTPTAPSISSSSTTKTPTSIATAPPAGPSGPTAPLAADSSPNAPTPAPVSGLAEVGKTGFPTVLLVLLLCLLASAAALAVGPRLWQRWEPALPWGPDVDKEVRLGALARASASGAELQKTIASRRATRSAGRAG